MQDNQTKLAKLRKGQELLEWLAVHTESELYTTSRQIRGFERISYETLGRMVGSSAK